MKIQVTAEDATEIRHKLGVLRDTEDLCDDYGVTAQQVDGLLRSVPAGGEWEVPDWAQEAVRGEMLDHAAVLRDIAHDARRHRKEGEALRIAKQAKRFERMFSVAKI